MNAAKEALRRAVANGKPIDWNVIAPEKAGRFTVSVWHGEGGSIFEVRDRVSPDSCHGIYSTIRHGGEAASIARQVASDMNAAYASGGYAAALAVCGAAGSAKP